MSRILSKAFLQSDLAAAKEALSTIGDDDVYLLDRSGIEARVREIESELRLFEERAGKTGKTVCSFTAHLSFTTTASMPAFPRRCWALPDLISKQVAALLGL